MEPVVPPAGRVRLKLATLQNGLEELLDQPGIYVHSVLQAVSDALRVKGYTHVGGEVLGLAIACAKLKNAQDPDVPVEGRVV